MIKIVKLITGDEVVANVSKDKGVFTLKNPTRIMVTQEGVAMMPLCPFTDEDNIKIKESHVLYELEAEIEVKNAYNSKFGSGIVTASANDMRVMDADSGFTLE